MLIEQLDLEELAQRYETPLIVYSEARLLQNISLLRSALPNRAELIFSLKASYNPAVLHVLYEQGLLVETASEGEFVHATNYGIQGDRILYGGPIKQASGITKALQKGTFCFNVESEQDLLRVKECAERLAQPATVLFRLNAPAASTDTIFAMSGARSRFGVEEEQLADLVALCTDGTVSYGGLFMYAGSQYLDAESIVRNTRALCHIAKRQRQQGLPAASILDFGGGFGVPETPEQQPLCLEQLHAGLTQVFEEELPALVDDGLSRVFFESGRFLTTTAAVVVTKVMDVKRTGENRHIIVDSGLNNLGIKQMRESYVAPVSVLGKEEGDRDGFAEIFGPTCLPFDFVRRRARFPEVEVGDLLLVHNCGAYSIGVSPANFCGHPSPAEIIVKTDGSHFITRHRAKIADACGMGYVAPSTSIASA